MTDSRVSRGIVQVLVVPDPDARVSRGILQTLVVPDPDARVSRGILQVLTQTVPPDPTVVATDPNMWLDAHLVDSSDGATVASWRDTQYKTTNAVQATAGSRPTYRTGRTPSGGPTVDFATGKFMTSTQSRSAVGQTIIGCVKRAASTPATETRCLVGASGTGGLLVRTSDTHRVTLRAQGVADFGTGTTPLPSGWSLVSSRVTSGAGGSWSNRIDRAADASGATTQALTAGTTTVIGSFATGAGSYWDGEIAELLTWSRVLSDTEVGDIEDYLYAKWIASTGPTITWWDGDSREVATIKGWWDGSTLQPVNVLGWWDGSSIQPLN